MGTTILPDNYTYNGPWILTIVDLLELERKLLEIHNMYDVEKKRIIAEHYKNSNVTDEMINKYSKEMAFLHTYGDNISINVVIKNSLIEKKYESISELVKDPDLNECIVIKLNIIINSYNNRLHIELNKNSFQGSLQLSVISNSESIKSNVIFILDDWIRRKKPKKAIQIWSIISSYIFFIGMVVLLIGTNIWSSFTECTQKNRLKEEAFELVSNGINDSNINKSIELLLKLNIDYTPKEVAINYISLIYFVIVVILFTVILTISPKTTIGIGKGKKRANFWRVYIHIITIFIPLSVLLPIFINWIS